MASPARLTGDHISDVWRLFRKNGYYWIAEKRCSGVEINPDVAKGISLLEKLKGLIEGQNYQRA
jgi:hypothetical protein